MRQSSRWPNDPEYYIEDCWVSNLAGREAKLTPYLFDFLLVPPYFYIFLRPCIEYSKQASRLGFFNNGERIQSKVNGACIERRSIYFQGGFDWAAGAVQQSHYKQWGFKHFFLNHNTSSILCTTRFEKNMPLPLNLSEPTQTYMYLSEPIWTYLILSEPIWEYSNLCEPI